MLAHYSFSVLILRPHIEKEGAVEAAGEQWLDSLWRELKECPVVLGSSSIVCLASFSLMGNSVIPLLKQSQRETFSMFNNN